MTTEIILDNKQINENIFFNPIISSHGQKKLEIHLSKYRKVVQPPHVLLIENNIPTIIMGICGFIVVLVIGCIIICCVDFFQSTCLPCSKNKIEVNAEMSSVSFDKKLEEVQVLLTKIDTIKENMDKEIFLGNHPSTSTNTSTSTPNMAFEAKSPMLPKGVLKSSPTTTTSKVEDEIKTALATIEQPLNRSSSIRRSLNEIVRSALNPYKTAFHSRKDRQDKEDRIG